MRNIVAITFDSLRADHCGYTGYHRDTTPTIDEMAREGVAFTNAIAPASRTNPSMAGIFTGEPLVVRDKVANNDHSSYHLKRHGTIAEDLREQGYVTGAFCPNAYSSRYYGFDRGFDDFEDFLFQNAIYQKLFESHLSDSSMVTWLRNIRNYVRRQEAFKTWETYVDEMVAWVEDHDQPFFLWAFSLDTHFPYITPRKDRRWGSLLEMYYYNWRCNQLIDEFDIDLSEHERRKMINIYDDSIRYADRLVQALRDRLTDYDPVYVIFGDHGEAFGERNMYGHFYPSLYEENIRVPLVIWDPKKEIGKTVETPFSLLELRSVLSEIVDGGGSRVRTRHRTQPVISIDYDGRWNRALSAVKVGDLKCIGEMEGSEWEFELYDLGEDPEESRDLSDSRQELASELEQFLRNRIRHSRERLAIREGARSMS